MRIRGDLAWQQTLENPDRSWSGERFSTPLMKVRHKPKFAIAPSASYFCMGSCFARNIEEHLLVSGANVLSKKTKCPPKEGGLRNNGWLNKFTTASMLNDIRWAVETPTYDATWFEHDSSGWRDLQLSPGVSPVDDVEDLIEQRRYVSEKYFSRIAEADVLVLTLGLNEVWWDNQNRRYLNAPPQRPVVRREPERFWLIRSDTAANLEFLEKIYAAAMELRKGIKLVVTVSPVPMDTTFSGEDVIIANNYSKSTLISAARSFVESKDDCDYYSSYESVVFSHHDAAYAADGVHVRDHIVSDVTSEFISLYTGARPENPEGFQELAYLAANTDVEKLVKAGEIGSGYEHWNTIGRRENRLLRLPEATDRMRVVGAV